MNYTNQMEDSNLSCYSSSVVEYQYFAVVWGCFVIITGTVGNLMTILAFALDSRLQTRFNVLIVNLAVTDLLYCTILQPMGVYFYLHLRWRTSRVWCQIYALLIFLTNSVSIITLCLVAVSRYLMVAKRAVFNRVFSNLGLTLLVVSAWGLGLASFAPLWSVYMFVPQVCTCSFHRTKGRPYSTIILFFYFFIGLGCIGVFYMLIYRKVRVASKALLRYRLSISSSRKKSASSAQGTDDSGVESGVGKTCSSEISSQAEPDQNTHDIEKAILPPQSSAPPLKSSDDKLETQSAAPASQSPTPGDNEFNRVTRMCFAVFLCFLCSFAPYLLLNIVDKGNRAPQVLHMFFGNLTWINSFINPILYALMNRQFRQAYSELLSRAAAPFIRLCSWRQTYTV
ncbi:PREDICTED: G-protein coupled receptor 84-like [Poecilia mexicana]|uniref:G-protein coupled receptor 84-like n=1 Tax=Poecilia mexicana TaxID=48701 RepID=UPI00072EBFA5|nr:PREDICTED: G-protein coupled receptor 84-like [Poecilia mexicana]